MKTTYQQLQLMADNQAPSTVNNLENIGEPMKTYTKDR
jgi:hypothetical protein